MAGPTVSIIVPKVLSSIQLGKVSEIIRRNSDTVDGKDFYIDNRLYLWCQGEEWPGDFDEYYEFSDQFWNPKDQISLIAMCKGKSVQHSIANLACLIAEEIGGMIDLGGDIDLGQLEYEGEIYKAYYESCEAELVYSHICDYRFLRWWMCTPSFTMF